MTISNPADRKKIRDALQEVSNSMTRISAERDLIKEIVSELAEEYELLSKKQINKMARVYHKQNFSEEQAASSEFELLYEEIVLLNTGTKGAQP
jgi:regulator of replication initiation timing